MALPFTNTWIGKALDILPYIILIGLFISAIVAQTTGCADEKKGGLAAALVPRLTAPRLIG
jgi:hypothetical protein